MEFEVREMKRDEWREWAKLRGELFDISFEDARVDCEQFVAGAQRDLKVVFVAIVENHIVGFAEVSERSYADGCYDGPVAFLEGWMVKTEFQKCGIGRALIRATVEWAKAHDYPHLASDAELENTQSHMAHAACGFEEIDRVVQYRMALK